MDKKDGKQNETFNQNETAMKKLKLRTLLSAAALVALAGGMALTPKAHAAQTLLWSDEFNGTSVDTSKWTVYNQADGSKSWYSPTNVTVSGGELRIANVEKGTADQWGGGDVESASFFPQYKYLEARVKFSVGHSDDWGTWWTVGWTNNSLKWPPEMDIMELQGDTTTNKTPGQTYWWNWAGSGNTYIGRTTGVDESQWHTYGLWWTATDSPIFYVDGLMTVAPVGPGEGDQWPAKLKLTSSPNSNTRVPGCLLATMEVDYVRVYDTPPDQPAHVQHLALNKPAIASSYKNTGGTPDRVVDGMDGSGSVTRWESEWIDPQWVCVDLQAVCSITSVVFNWQNAAAATYDIQVSSQWWGPWTNCISVTGGAPGWHTDTFAAKTGRYVRFNGKTRTTAYGYSLYDMQVFGTVVNPSPGAPPARPNMALNKLATASSVETGGTLTPNLAVDGNVNTRWSSAFVSPQWLCVDLGATNPVDTVVINWQAAAAKSYYIQVANNTNGPWTKVYDRTTVSNSTPGIKYDIFPSVNARYVEVYCVSRYNTAYGFSIFELQVFGGAATNSGGGTAPPAPTGLTPTVVSSSQINLSWNASTGATSYNVKRATVSGGPYTTIASGVTATSYSDTGLSASTTYYYVVSAVNANGESANSSQVSATTSAGGTPPPVPTGLTPTVISSNQINLSWNASTGATSYNVKRATVSGGPYTTIATGVTGTSYNNTGLTPATTYYYVVSAVNANGESANSSQVSGTTTGGGGGDVLLSQGHPATASTSQSGHAPAAGNDGSLSTRWSASSSSYPQWWRVDLGASHTLHSATINWLNSDTRSYKYTIDVSSDDVTYTTVVNQSNRTATGDSTDNFNTTGRYVRITVTGSNGGSASFYECKVMGQ